MSITNQQVAGREFLRGLYPDEYFPDRLLDKGRDILLRLCERIEAERPADLAGLYVLTAVATLEFNRLQEEFWAAGSEIETMARDEIAGDFGFVASAYGFADADLEEVVAERDW
ncbi:DUF5713 family protein [Streptomyces niveus]|uniref:Uncharacterized protein n=1 Tax=Streptomyces niveus TaxID=193462 RepID=A0A1U9R4C2_STRNV|nr:DUF5713 family protein [Streptomyces niveus]AQU70951.1 hypothetical protein BBN63_15925 [Streptomyces niveus]